jgi:hypothetical protein
MRADLSATSRGSGFEDEPNFKDIEPGNQMQPLVNFFDDRYLRSLFASSVFKLTIRSLGYIFIKSQFNSLYQLINRIIGYASN